MLDTGLPLPATEERFWREVAYRWTRSAGLLLAVVPADLNVPAMGRWVRDYACRPPVTDRVLYEIAPDVRSTYCYDLGAATGPLTINGERVLSKALADADKQEAATSAVQGDSPFYLMVTGLAIPDDTSLARWTRSLAAQWLGVRPGAPLSEFYCCCVVTAPLPGSQPALPEGCDWILLQDNTGAEISLVVQDAVESLWPQEDQYTRRYISSGLVDMASGRRTHAELALEVLRDEWASGRTKEPGWRPQWAAHSQPVEDVRRLLAVEGLTTSWLQARTRCSSASEQDEATIARQLWAQGLWCSHLEDGDLWQGLTSLAKAALQPVNAGNWSMPLYLPDATMHVLRRCMQVEQQIKHWLGHLTESKQNRERLQQALDSPSDMKPGTTRREFILQQRPEWAMGMPSERLRHDITIVSMCSFGTLKEILFDLVPPANRRELLKPLTELIRARNMAAHGGWFTLSEYRAICEQSDRTESILSRLRI